MTKIPMKLAFIEHPPFTSNFWHRYPKNPWSQKHLSSETQIPFPEQTEACQAFVPKQDKSENFGKMDTLGSLEMWGEFKGEFLGDFEGEIVGDPNGEFVGGGTEINWTYCLIQFI